ncbi:hypothetical protein DENSPDRAFT_149697 [Dentipellis sp. KUC8613]|nr:hypothetical protein DENSPDRAFT_149697 [Dentipellis sp. KUC8613]
MNGLYIRPAKGYDSMVANVLRKSRDGAKTMDSTTARNRTEGSTRSPRSRIQQAEWTMNGKAPQEIALAPLPTGPIVQSANISDIPQRPVSQAEQYWAARALRAEVLLSARVDHHQELKNVMRSEEMKRERQISELQRAHDGRQQKMEYIIIIAVFCITVLASALIYLLSSWSREKPTAKWGLASHFTIPILSPFTSVVEHETSVIGTKTIVLSIIVFAGFTYLTLKTRLIHR